MTIGKLRGLQQCATAHKTFAMLAMDHRQNLRRMLNPSAPGSVSVAALSEFKRQVVALLAPYASATLLDPEFGAAQCIASSALPGGCGLMVALEATGYEGKAIARQSRILDGWSVGAIRRMGASAVKLLVYYHPDAPTAHEIEALVAAVARDCAEWDIPLFLEPLSYALNPEQKKLAPDEYRHVVIETARRLTPLGIDVLKAEFPVNILVDEDEAVWSSACRELSAASRVPWILLSASVAFETFLKQVLVACRAGASGVAVGRAVWQEAIELKGTARAEFLATLARQRMQRLSGLCDAFARPLSDFYSLPIPDGHWYRQYANPVSGRGF